MDDLDDLLDGVDINTLPSKKGGDNILNDAASSILSAPSSKSSRASPAAIKESDRVLTKEVNPWLAASANCPREHRDKWTKMVKLDVDITMGSNFNQSNAYLNWYNTKESKTGIEKCLQDLVRKSGSNSGLTDAKISKILQIINPVIDSEHGKQIQEAYALQIMKDFKGKILADPNYDSTRFTNVAVAAAK